MPVATHRNHHGRDMMVTRRSTTRRPAFGMTHDPTLRTNQSEHDEAQHHAANQNADTHPQSDAARIMQVGRVGCRFGNVHPVSGHEQPVRVHAIRGARHQRDPILPVDHAQLRRVIRFDDADVVHLVGQGLAHDLQVDEIALHHLVEPREHGRSDQSAMAGDDGVRARPATGRLVPYKCPTPMASWSSPVPW